MLLGFLSLVSFLLCSGSADFDLDRVFADRPDFLEAEKAAKELFRCISLLIPQRTVFIMLCCPSKKAPSLLLLTTSRSHRPDRSPLLLIMWSWSSHLLSHRILEWLLTHKGSIIIFSRRPKSLCSGRNCKYSVKKRMRM